MRVSQVSSVSISETIYHETQIEAEHVEVLMKGLPGGHKKTCGLAQVKMKTQEDALTVMRKLDGYKLFDRQACVALRHAWRNCPLGH